jgi:hypothetical protein
LGDPAAVGKAAKTTKVRAALTDSPATAPESGKRAEVSRGAAYTILDQLVAKGQAQRTGTGKRGDPYLYCNFVLVFPLRGGDPNETNSTSGTSDHDGCPPEGIVSFTPPTLREEPKQHEMKGDGIVSFGGDGGQKKRNEGRCEPEPLFVEEVINDES